MFNRYKKEIVLIIVLIILGQAVFALYAKRYTTGHYENRIYATMGIRNDSTDLQKLNDAAHYFGQTIIGWTKFPHFVSSLIKESGLPEGSDVNAHMQERQNIVFTVTTRNSIDEKALVAVKDFIQKQLDSYNKDNNTHFLLSNVDYEQVQVKNTYGMGAAIAFALSLVLSAAILFVKRELL